MTTIHALTAENRHNFHHLYADIFWFGIVSGSVMAFIAIYAARLGANGFQISLLTAGPAVMNFLFSLPAGRWLEGKGLVPVTFWSAVLNRAGYLAFVLLPWLLPDRLEVWGVVAVTVLMSLPGTVVAISFNAMFADVVPPDVRADVVGKRNALIAVSMTATTLICGQILDTVVFPLNYQIVFALGAVGAALSTYHLYHIRPLSGSPPQRVGRPLGDFARPGIIRFLDTFRQPPGLRFLTRARGRALLRLDLLKSAFGPLLLAYLLFYTFQYIPLPLFPLVFVNELQLSDGAISLGSALFYMVMLLFSLQVGKLSARYGHRRVLAVGAISYSLYPLMIGLARDASIYWVASLLGGAFWALTNAGLINRLMEVMPEGDRPAYLAMHNLALNIGILSGSMLGPLLGDWMGLHSALLLSAALRLAAGLLLLKWA